MVSQTRFYRCDKCENTFGMIHGTEKNIPMCCGERMVHIEPEINDSGKGKVVPRVSVSREKVSVTVEGECSVRWIYLQTDRGGQRKCIRHTAEPIAEFFLCDEKPVACLLYTSPSPRD